MDRPESDRSKVIIGVDLGTVFTSICFLALDNGDRSPTAPRTAPKLHIRDIQELSFKHGKQTRTQLAWHPSEKRWLWGDGVDLALAHKDIRESHRLQLLKLGMNGLEQFEWAQEVRLKQQNVISNLPSNANCKTPNDLIVIFLNRLFLWAKEKITRATARVHGKGILEVSTLHCVISAPAIWEPRVNSILQRAAVDAGMPVPEIVSEPEAAAIMILHEGAGRIPPSKSLIVCDGGGGTFDFTAYKNQSAEGLMPEAGVGTGGLFGSMILNEKFRVQFERRYREVIDRLVHERGKPNAALDRQDLIDTAVGSFEREKQNFHPESGDDGSESKRIVIDIPGVKAIPGSEVKDDYIEPPTKHVKILFDGMIEKVYAKLDEMINTCNEGIPTKDWVEYILFVGGVSRSVYVSNALRHRYDESRRMDYPVQVLTTHEDSQTLIARGTILKSLYRNALGHRYLRCSIGVGQVEEYDPNIHTEEEDANVHGENGKVQPSDYTSGYWVMRRARWLFNAVSLDSRYYQSLSLTIEQKEAISPGTTKSIRGIKYAILLGDDIEVDESFYFCMNRLPDHIPIDDPRYGK